MSKIFNHIKGVNGEELAVKYLEKHRYKILDRNFTCHFGEIDIVAKDGKYTVFVEVKMRSNTYFGLPREAVTDEKQYTIIGCSKLWLAKNCITGTFVRYDVVEILGDKITLIKDAFRV